MTVLHLDYESRSEIDLKARGLDRYSGDPSTQIILCSYKFDGSERTHLWDYHDGTTIPAELREALADPGVVKKAFNAQFERVMTNRVLGVRSPIANWRCTMARAYLMSFTKTLKDVGQQMGLAADKQKDAEGDRLIRLFCKPQRVTKNQPFRWRDALTDPEDWERFREYCRQDTNTEHHIAKLLERFYVPESEWQLYELDQKINDQGLPIAAQYVDNALKMAERRKAELSADLREVTELDNPNSNTQFLPWLQKRGYPFADLQKDTVKKVLKENKDTLAPEAMEALLIRQNANRTSTAKYTALQTASGRSAHGPVFRFGFQFAGAQRTARWAGRRIQAQNLPRTPKLIEELPNLTMTTEIIRRGDYEGLQLMVGEPMTALVGCIRSAIRAPEGQELRVCDLSSIETCVIAWLAKCRRLLNVINAGYDPYKDFGVILYKNCFAPFGSPRYEAAYAQVDKTERTNSKPAVLGAGYRLGGGDLIEGKRTGLWGYAESMGIDLSKDESHQAVTAYRTNYPEVPELWSEYERAIAKCLRTGEAARVGLINFELKKPFLMVTLPSGRSLYYYKPAMQKKTFTKVVGEDKHGPVHDSWTKNSFSYMGQDQKTGKWTRIFSHGGKMLENFVQAIARDILKEGLLDADKEGFTIAGHVHDEIIAQQAVDNETHTLDLLGECMTRPRAWTDGLPLGYDGWTGPFYRK